MTVRYRGLKVEINVSSELRKKVLNLVNWYFNYRAVPNKEE